MRHFRQKFSGVKVLDESLTLMVNQTWKKVWSTLNKEKHTAFKYDLIKNKLKQDISKIISDIWIVLQRNMLLKVSFFNCRPFISLIVFEMQE